MNLHLLLIHELLCQLGRIPNLLLLGALAQHALQLPIILFDGLHDIVAIGHVLTLLQYIFPEPQEHGLIIELLIHFLDVLLLDILLQALKLNLLLGLPLPRLRVFLPLLVVELAPWDLVFVVFGVVLEFLVFDLLVVVASGFGLSGLSGGFGRLGRGLRGLWGFWGFLLGLFGRRVLLGAEETASRVAGELVWGSQES